MISCLIVDDEQHSIDVLEHHVRQCNMLHLTKSTTNAIEALNLIMSSEIDLVFLDVHMPDISGIDIVKSVSGRCKVILTTAYPEYALEGYDFGIVDYLLKPISYPRFLKAVQKVGESIPLIERSAGVTDANYVYVKGGLKNNVVKINFNDIEYIESLKNYAAIYHKGRKTVAYLSMKELELTLPADRFLRIHKSFIISMQHIARIEGCEVELTGIATRIYIGDSYKTRFWNIIRERTLG